MLRRIEKNTRTALVTYATSGIGECFARRLASVGYRVVLVSGEKEALEVLSHDIVYQHDVDVLPICVDLKKDNIAHYLLKYTSDRSIMIDVLVNNIGEFVSEPLVDMSEDKIESILDIHVKTITMMCRTFARDMKNRGVRGFILNMSSLAARVNMPDESLYSASASYIRSFSKALHHALKKDGITITVVSPGMLTTDTYGISVKYLHIGKMIGLISDPKRVATDSLRALFARRKSYIPGFMNRFFIFVFRITPSALWRGIKNKISGYEN